MSRIASLSLLLCLFACEGSDADPEPSGWITDVEAPLPERLSETGLYGDLGALSPGAGIIPYEPRHALWSNAAAKDRLLFLPEGARIDASDGEVWDLPVGAVLAKTFTYPGIQDREAQAPIETRVLFRRGEGWDFAVYQWNEQGTEARRLVDDVTGPGPTGDGWFARPIALKNADGSLFRYTIPGRLDCAACHETRVEGQVLGLSALQAPADLLSREIFVAAPQPAELAGRTPEEDAAMGYVVGNCAFCHHGKGGTDNAAFSLRPADLVHNTVNRETESSASGVGIRVVPGDTAASALFQAVVLAREPDYEGDVKPMPPVGVEVVDPEGARVLRAWIEGLPREAGGEE